MCKLRLAVQIVHVVQAVQSGCCLVKMLRAVLLTLVMSLQGQDRALTDAWIGNMLMDPQKGKQEVLTSNNEVSPQIASNHIKPSWPACTLL